jgi:16S rRNA (adenine1518-N6/adenine1519-N6)-dimethyltransferase
MGNTKELVKRFNIRLTKSLGQNFLTDDAVLNQIVDAADVNKKDFIIEVGSGVGSMTSALALRAASIIGIEIDKHLIPALRDNLKEFSNVEIINEDILKIDLKNMVDEKLTKLKESSEDTSVKVIANLPYYITTPIIMKFLEEAPGIDAMVFMVQKEVADRMCAPPGGKDYGALSIAVQYYSKPEKIFNVPPHCFIPQPNVDSTVIKLNVLKVPPVELLSKDMFFKTVKAAFAQRRKTLVNALSNSGYFTESKTDIVRILKELGIDEKRRGETLSIMQFAQLSNSFFTKI